jgi:hypothetical protein
MSFTAQQPLAADGGSDPLMLEATQSVLSSTASFTTTSITSTSQSIPDALDSIQVGALCF